MQDEGMFDRSVGTAMTMETAAAVWLSRYSSPNTRAAYSYDLRAFLAWAGDDAVDVTSERLAEYRAERAASGVNPATVNRQFAALRAFFDTARDLGMRDDSPFEALLEASPPGSTTLSITSDEAASLLSASTFDRRAAVLVHLLLCEGMRLGEILGLDHSDVAGPRSVKRLRLVRRRRPVQVEVGHAGSAKIHDLQQSSPSPGPLFVGPARTQAASNRLTRFGADHLLKRVARHASVDRAISANVLRRAYVTAAQDAGVSIHEIGERMGHRDVRTTQRYLASPIPTTDNPEGS
jgi:site-specific recombinase XerD